MTLKQLQNVSPPIMKQVLPLVEQLPPLYMDLAKGREEFTPKPEETRRLVCDISDYYYSSNFILLISEGFVLSFTLNNLSAFHFNFMSTSIFICLDLRIRVHLVYIIFFYSN